jgi:hypothetical protein
MRLNALRNSAGVLSPSQLDHGYQSLRIAEMRATAGMEGHGTCELPVSHAALSPAW